VFTLGFSPEYVIRVLGDYRVSDVSRVIVFSVKPRDEYSSRRAGEALETVRVFLRGLGAEDRLVLREVDVDASFEELVIEVFETLLSSLSSRGGDIHCYLTGGLRVLIVAALIGVKLFSEIVGVTPRVFLYSEDMSNRYEVVFYSFEGIASSHEELLKLLKTGEASISDLARKLGMSPSYVSEALSKLERAGLARCERRGRLRVCRITAMGIAFLDAKRIAWQGWGGGAL